MEPAKRIGYCALLTIAALYVVGLVSNGVLRHVVQTAPLWFLVAMGLRGHESAKWAALPCFALWLVLMSLIWMFLLGWSRIVSGTFTPIEVAMTLVVGAASVAGLVNGFRWRTKTGWGPALSTALLFAILQVAALRISFLPSIAKDR